VLSVVWSIEQALTRRSLVQIQAPLLILYPTKDYTTYNDPSTVGSRTWRPRTKSPQFIAPNQWAGRECHVTGL